MSRPLRIEFPGALYHVTSRGDRREPIYKDDEDRRCHLAVLGDACSRFGSGELAYCLMGNHYHLMLPTREGRLSRFMRHLNGVYTQAFNRRHGLVGHLFQGRFKSVLVDGGGYFVALCRYVERNPVAAGLVQSPERWPWSSCRAHLGLEAPPFWLAVAQLHRFELGRNVLDLRDRQAAIKRYGSWVRDAHEADAAFWSSNLRAQVFLGDESIIESMWQRVSPQQNASTQVPLQQRRPLPIGPRSWAGWLGEETSPWPLPPAHAPTGVVHHL
jgi:putative transposase